MALGGLEHPGDDASQLLPIFLADIAGPAILRVACALVNNSKAARAPWSLQSAAPDGSETRNINLPIVRGTHFNCEQAPIWQFSVS